MATETPLATQPRAGRMSWLDANRVFAAVGVVLVHSTTDTAGQPFAQAPVPERIVPVFLRGVGELSGSELFVLFSMFLLAAKLERSERSYGAVMKDQLQRLFVPFLAWTLFYAFFRLIKANAFGYGDAIMTQLSVTKNWVDYVLLGSAQYHLHFIPTLLGILLFFPLFVSARRFPLLGTFALLFALVILNNSQGWMWERVRDAEVRDYLVRALKICCYTGYGMAAFALHGLWKRKLDEQDSRALHRGALFFVFVACVASGPYLADIVIKARWVVRPTAGYYAHFLMPVFIFAAFMGTAHRAWSPRFSKLSKFTFGVYLLHPAFIDLYDVVARHAELQLDPTVQVLSKWCFAVPMSFGTSYLLSKTPLLAWTIGLQEREAKPAPVATAPVRMSVSN